MASGWLTQTQMFELKRRGQALVYMYDEQIHSTMKTASCVFEQRRAARSCFLLKVLRMADWSSSANPLGLVFTHIFQPLVTLRPATVQAVSLICRSQQNSLKTPHRSTLHTRLPWICPSLYMPFTRRVTLQESVYWKLKRSAHLECLRSGQS